MKQVLAILVVLGAVAFFASESKAQCFRSPGFNTGGVVYGSSFYRHPNAVHYRSFNSYNVYGHPGTRVYRSYQPVYGHRGGFYPHTHGRYYGGARSGFYYQGNNLGVRIRF